MLAFTFVGVVLGLALAYLLYRERLNKGVLYDDVKIRCVQLEAQCETEKNLAETYKRQLEALEICLPQQFKSISSELFKENAQSFVHLAEEGMKKYASEAKESLGGQRILLEKTLDPLKEKLKTVSEKIELLERTREQSVASLKEHLNNLNQMQLRLEGKTDLLSRSLSNSGPRSRWGEMQLRRVVEMAGMLEYVDFNVQQTLRNGLLRPDMVIHLPNQRTIIVDAKTPQWDDFLSADTEKSEESVQKTLQTCCQRIRELVSRLSSKAYDSFVNQSADFVVLFFPGEWIFSRILQIDPSLIEYACQANLVFATPTTLIALLKAVHYGWRQNKMVEDIQEMGVLGNELYERLLTFGNYCQDLRKNLLKTIESFNQLLGSLETRLLPSAKKLNTFSKKNTPFELPHSIDTFVRDLK